MYCKGEDGNNYFVKGYYASRRSLINEYVCGKLAIAFGLPIADFSIVEIQPELIALAQPSDAQFLSSGPSFGSREVTHAQELSYAQRSKIDRRLGRDILMFDWWIRNGDRTLTEIAGNPNLLWNQKSRKLAVIDHNLAFDQEFNISDFTQHHVFRDQWPIIFGDMLERNEYQERLAVVLPVFEEACNAIPEEWWSVDHGVPVDFDCETAKAILTRVLDNNFWDVV